MTLTLKTSIGEASVTGPDSDSRLVSIIPKHQTVPCIALYAYHCGIHVTARILLRPIQLAKLHMSLLTACFSINFARMTLINSKPHDRTLGGFITFSTECGPTSFPSTHAQQRSLLTFSNVTRISKVIADGTFRLDVVRYLFNKKQNGDTDEASSADVHPEQYIHMSAGEVNRSNRYVAVVTFPGFFYAFYL